MSTLDAKITITAVDKVSAVIKSINNSIQQISSATKNLNSAMSSVTTATGRVVRDIRNLSFMFIGAGAAIFGTATKTASMSEEILIASQNAGVGTEALQKLRFAALRNRISFDDMDNSLKFLNKSIGTALTDSSSEAAKAFTSMGLNLKNSDGSVKATNAVLEEMADKFKNAADGPTKVTTALTLMGRSGSETIAFLNQGTEAIRKQGEEAVKLGGILSEDILKTNAIFDDQIDDLTFAIRGIVSTIGSQLIPILMPVIKSMIEWVKVNKQWMSDKIRENVINLSDGLKAVWKQLINIKDFIMPVINALGGFKNIIIALAGIYVIKLLSSIINLGVAVYGLVQTFVLLGAAMLASPITWVIGGLLLIGAAVYLLVKNWDKVREAMGFVWDYAKPFIEGLLNIITFGMYGIVKAIVNNWDAITAYLSSTMTTILGFITSTWDGITTFLAEKLNLVLGLFGANLDQVKSYVVAFVDYVTAPFKQLFEFIVTLGNKIVELKSSIFGDSEKAVNQQVNVTRKIMPAGINMDDIGTSKQIVQVNKEAANMPVFGDVKTQQSRSQGSPITEPTNNTLDINMTIDYEGRPTKVTAKSPNPQINFAASVGKMV